MKRNLFLTAVLIALFSNAINAQTTIDFESLAVPDVGYYDGSSDHPGTIGLTETYIYETGGAVFYVTYTQENGYGYWNGLAYSNQTDLTTTGYTNYSAYALPAGGGANSSDNYIFSYGIDSIMFNQTAAVQNFKLTNSTYAYLYMDGTDAGGYEYTTGDYFILTITGIMNDNTVTGSVDFYLADFTNGNSYIIDNWTDVDLTSLGNVDGLKFTFSSSDEGQYGINTPLYYCLDNLNYSDATSVENIQNEKISIFPNPATDYVNIKDVSNSNIKINDIAGKNVYTKNNCSENEIINISNFKSGMYFINIENNKHTFTKKLIVK